MLTLTRSGRINVIHPVTRQVHSSHYQEREAIESALNLAMELGRDVTIRYDQTVLVATDRAVQPPEPSGLMGVAPTGNTMRTHPPIAPGTPTWYAKPTDANGDGTERDPMHLSTALSMANPGDVVRIVPGAYRIKERILRTAEWSEQVLVDATGVTFDAMPDEEDPVPEGMRVLQLSGANEVWHGLTIRGGDRGVLMNGYRNTISGFLVERTARDGIYIYGDAKENELRDVHIRNVGSASVTGTNTADGIALTASRGSLTEGHTLVRVVVENAPDDGIDLYRAHGCNLLAVVVINPGFHHEAGDVGGDGAGIKLGGDAGSGENSVSGALVINAKGEAIKANSAPLPVFMENCTVVKYGQIAFNPFIVQGSAIRGCIAAGGSYPYTGEAVQESNSWELMEDATHALLEDHSVRPSSALASFGVHGEPIGATDETLACFARIG